MARKVRLLINPDRFLINAEFIDGVYQNMSDDDSRKTCPEMMYFN